MGTNVLDILRNLKSGIFGLTGNQIINCNMFTRNQTAQPTLLIFLCLKPRIIHGVLKWGQI